MNIKPNITDFSHELLCHILKYLPLREILSVAMLCRKMLAAVDMHLRLCKSIDFCQDSIFGYMPSAITDDHLLTLLKKCPHLEIVYGLHPVKIERRRLRKRAALTIPGIIEALSLCFHLKAIETSDLRLFEAIMQHLPQLEIIGHFQNRNGLFPPQASQRLKLQPYPRISSLHLIGVEVPELTAMPHLQHLHLECVRFTKLQPFRAFLAQNLKSFIMKHCIGPSVPQRYLSLIIALSSSPNLKHLELVRVPLLNGLFQRAVEDSYRHNGFINLRTLVISGCKGILEADLGHLMIVASKHLETLYIQPSLTKDSLFVSLSFAQCSFPALRHLHLGYIDNLNSSGEWSNDTLLSFGLAEVPDTPSSLTDSGMKVISRLFPNIKTLSVSNCPHLMVMYHWMTDEDLEAWSRLTDLTLQKCHCLQLSSFILFISFLPNIQVVILNDMFREPPKGCSHVGLSAGTGLGMSSAVVSNQDEHIAVQGHHQEFEPPGDEENEEIDREFIDVENEDIPEPQFMVLQRDFFDGEDNEEVVGNPPLENEQDLPIEDLELNINGYEINNNFLPDGNISNENILGDTLGSPSSVSDKYISSETFACKNHNIKDSKYCLRNSSKKIKSSNSDFIEKNILSSDSCCCKDIKDEVCDDDYYNAKINSKLPVGPYSLHECDYDPHKPSTSKAGSHLNFSDLDHENECSKDSQRLNKSSDGENISEKQQKLSKVIKDATVDEKSKKDCKVSSQSNSFDYNINSDFKEEDSNCIKEELPENTFYAQRNSSEIPVSFNTDKIPENMVCYVVIKRMEIKVAKIASPAENDDDRALHDNNLSTNISCSDSSDDDKYRNEVNNSNKNEKRNIYIDSLQSKENYTYPQKESPFVENNCSCVNANEFNSYSKGGVTSNSYKPKINKIHTNENANNISNSKKKINFSDELSEKKPNDVHAFSEPEILLDHSFNMPAEDILDKNADMMHFPVEENSSSTGTEDKLFQKKILCNIQSDSITKYDSCIATQTCTNNLDDKDSDLNSISPDKNETSLVHSPMNKSLDVFKSDLHKPDKIVAKKNSFEETTSKNLKSDYSLESSKIIKPCSVLITKIENTHTHFTKYFDNKSKNVCKNSKEIIHNQSLEPTACEYSPVLNTDENSHKEHILSKNLEVCNSLPSTSRDGSSISHNSNKHSKKFKKMHSSKYFKKGKSSVVTRSKNVNSSAMKASSKNETNCSISQINMKNDAESNSLSDLSECSPELPLSDAKRLKKFHEIDHSEIKYNEDAKFYVSVTNNGPFKIVNSITGESYQTPHCHVIVTQMNEESCDNFQKKLKLKEKLEKSQKSLKPFLKQCENNLELDLDLPSTSKAANHLNNISEKVINLNDKKKIHEEKENYVKCLKCKKLSDCCCNGSVLLDCGIEKLYIKNSDAKILLKQCSTEEKSKTNTHQLLSYKLDTNDTDRCKNEICDSYCDQKFKIEPNDMPTSENSSYRIKINDDNLENNESSSSSEEKALNSGSYTQQKKRKRRKAITLLKRVKKSLSESKVKIDNVSRDHMKNNSKRTSSVPMVSLISQGTQATSADIRRSVRRIRRASTLRRTVPPVYTSKSRYSSKISAKTLTKRPMIMNPRPESHDKATSTSDPLLEDDAVQTLQLSSSTLLSFTVVSCGISDLIIDRCPKIIHIEVQACRILKKFQFNNCPVIRRLNVSQCPKLNACAIIAPVMSLSLDSYFLVSYEPCMQGYHPGEGEKAILSKASVNRSVMIVHDFCDISDDGIQGNIREKMIEWLQCMAQLHLYLKHSRGKGRLGNKAEAYQFSEYPWSHDLRKMHGHYSFSSSSDFCGTEGRYQLLTNNPILCDIAETHEHDSGFPAVRECAAIKDTSLISHEALDRYIDMQKKFIAFYIPVTESNQTNF